jgi:DNA-binding protein HU-beta
MTKSELADKVAARTGLSASQARQVVETTIDVISDELAAGGEVALGGFGKFSVSHRAAREGRNPSTGATIRITASRAAKFSAASALKQRLNASSREGTRRGPVPGDPDEDF